MSKKFLGNKRQIPEANSPRPNLADIPSIDSLLALYEKVLSELDISISTQLEFASTENQSEARHIV